LGEAAVTACGNNLARVKRDWRTAVGAADFLHYAHVVCTQLGFRFDLASVTSFFQLKKGILAYEVENLIGNGDVQVSLVSSFLCTHSPSPWW